MRWTLRTFCELAGRVRGRVWLCVWLCVWSAGGGSALVVGGGEGAVGWLWWVRPEVGREAVAISVARVGEASVEMSAPRRVHGRVRPWAAAASGDGRTLWLGFDGGGVSGWRVRDGGLRGVDGVGLERLTAPSLPGGGRVRAMVVSGGVPWVLWHAEHGASAARASVPAQDETDLFVERVLLLKLPAEIGGLSEETATPEHAEENEATGTLPQLLPAGGELSRLPEVLPGAGAGPRDVLLRLSGSAWVAEALPGDWPEQAAVAMLPGTGGVMEGGRGGRARPVLLARQGEAMTVWRTAASSEGLGRVAGRAVEDSDSGGAADVSQAAEEDEEDAAGWVARSYAFALRGGWSATMAGGQVLVVTSPPEVTPEVSPESPPEVPSEFSSGEVFLEDALAGEGGAGGRVEQAGQTVWALRGGGGGVGGRVRVGDFPRVSDGGVVGAAELESVVGVVGVGQTLVRVALPSVGDEVAALAAEEDALEGRLWSMDLNGRRLRDGEVMTIRMEASMGPPPSQTVLMGALMISTVVMLVFWRRDPAGQLFELPETVAVASLDRRAFAGAIDFALGFVAAWWWFGLLPAEVMERWPGRSEMMGWAAMGPAFLCVAVTVVHTAVSEAATGRSLGKALMGLRVVDRSGNTARGWRGLVRCLLKVLDLVAYLLLVLAVLSPLRQRLGDLVAGTVVVMDTPGAKEDSETPDPS